MAKDTTSKLGSESVSCSTNVRLTSGIGVYDEECGSLCEALFTVPCGFSREGLPVGLQIVGRRFADATVLRAAAAFEQALPWAERRPPLLS